MLSSRVCKAFNAFSWIFPQVTFYPQGSFKQYSVPPKLNVQLFCSHLPTDITTAWMSAGPHSFLVTEKQRREYFMCSKLIQDVNILHYVTTRIGKYLKQSNPQEICMGCRNEKACRGWWHHDDLGITKRTESNQRADFVVEFQANFKLCCCC